MALTGGTYEEVRSSFAWRIPHRFNIAEAICDRHVGSGRTALIHEDADGRGGELTFEHLQDRSKRLANALSAHGIGPGDRVGILLPQCPEALLAHLAAYRLGAVALPLFTLFGPDAIEYRLNDSGCKAVIADGEGVGKIAALRDRLTTPLVLVTVDGARDGGALSFAGLIEKASPEHMAVDTGADDPAIIVYTSGAAGAPQGVMLSHANLAAAAAMTTEFYGARSDEEVLKLLYGCPYSHTCKETYGEWRQLGAPITVALIRAGEAALRRE